MAMQEVSGKGADRAEIILTAIQCSGLCAGWPDKDQLALAEDIERLLQDAEGPVQE